MTDLLYFIVGIKLKTKPVPVEGEDDYRKLLVQQEAICWWWASVVKTIAFVVDEPCHCTKPVA